MTIVDKVLNLLKGNKEVPLNKIYEKLPEHSKSSIRGNINRYLTTTKNPKITRVQRGLYASIEILKVTHKDDKTFVNFSSKYTLGKKEVVLFNKDYEIKDNEALKDIKEGKYCKKDNYKNYSEMISSQSHLQSIIANGNAVDILKKLKSGSFDLLVTDPPYKVISGGNRKGKGQPTGMLSKNDGKIFKHNDIKFDEWIPEVFRVLKDNSQAYIFTNLLNLETLLDSCKRAGFKLHNLLIWEKNNVTPNRWYMKNQEYVLFLRKGKAKSINNKGSKTVHKFNNILGNKLHPTEKPTDLIRYYIENSSNEGDWVIDPFGGSMSANISGLEANRKVFSIELDNEFFKKGVIRVQDFLRTKDTMSTI